MTWAPIVFCSFEGKGKDLFSQRGILRRGITFSTVMKVWSGKEGYKNNNKNSNPSWVCPIYMAVLRINEVNTCGSTWKGINLNTNIKN